MSYIFSLLTEVMISVTHFRTKALPCKPGNRPLIFDSEVEQISPLSSMTIVQESGMIEPGIKSNISRRSS